MVRMPSFSIINIVVDKQGKPPTYDAFTNGWQALIQRFENTLDHGNFPGPSGQNETGMVFSDRTNEIKLRQLMRRMRRFNPIPNQQRFGPGYRIVPIQLITEDPNFRDSHESYFIQAIDVAAYMIFQTLSPNIYMKRKGGHKYFYRLDPVLCKHAATHDPHGIVWL